jgi:hypothetical protein
VSYRSGGGDWLLVFAFLECLGVVYLLQQWCWWCFGLEGVLTVVVVVVVAVVD